MDKFDRIFSLNKYIHNRRRAVTLDEICEYLECSKSTAKRIIEAYRDYLFAPFIYDREARGYRLLDSEQGPYELPGLWFNDSELFGLLLSHKLLTGIQPGLLNEHISPIRSRIEQLLLNRKLGGGELDKRIRILQMASRPADLKQFQMIASAVVQRKRIRILYHGRQKDKTTERDISPQRIIYYRDNWYLDGWCHARNSLRTFSIDRVHPVCTLDDPIREMSDEELDALLTTSYGIFAGTADHIARLRFTPAAAKWVADEHWHPDQKTKILNDGSLDLQIPYNNPTELIRDILKYGPEVKVISPASLKNTVSKTLKTAYEQY